LDEIDARKFAATFIKRDVEVAPLKEPETEELEFITDPTELGFQFNVQVLKPN
jgi:hypothetical protein